MNVSESFILWIGLFKRRYLLNILINYSGTLWCSLTTTFISGVLWNMKTNIFTRGCRIRLKWNNSWNEILKKSDYVNKNQEFKFTSILITNKLPNFWRFRYRPVFLSNEIKYINITDRSNCKIVWNKMSNLVMVEVFLCSYFLLY